MEGLKHSAGQDLTCCASGHGLIVAGGIHLSLVGEVDRSFQETERDSLLEVSAGLLERVDDLFVAARERERRSARGTRQQERCLPT